jgi:PKD repeat protein
VTAPPPEADFTGCATADEAPFMVSFSNQSSGNITGYLWDFGDGSSSIEKAPSHTYVLPGYYEISLSVTGPDGSDTLARADCVYVSPPEPAIEVGEVSVNQNEEARVKFTQHFANPIVVVKSLSANDSAPAMARIFEVDVNGDGFSVRVQEWDYLDDSHGTETLGYIVMERGLHQLRDDTMIEADEFQFSSEDNGSEHDFASAFKQEPVVITAVTSVNESDAVTTRIGNIDTFGFSLSLQEQKSSKQRHQAETVSFIAWEPSSGTIGGRQFEVGRLAGLVTDQPSVARFSSGFSLPPVFASDMQSMNDSDPANLRWSNKNADSVEVWVEEDQSRPSKLRYSGETVGYIAVDGDNTMQP